MCIHTHTHTVFNIIQCFFYMKDHKKSWLLVMANCKKTLKTNAFKLADIKWRLFFFKALNIFSSTDTLIHVLCLTNGSCILQNCTFGPVFPHALTANQQKLSGV